MHARKRKSTLIVHVYENLYSMRLRFYTHPDDDVCLSFSLRDILEIASKSARLETLSVHELGIGIVFKYDGKPSLCVRPDTHRVASQRRWKRALLNFFSPKPIQQTKD